MLPLRFGGDNSNSGTPRKLPHLVFQTQKQENIARSTCSEERSWIREEAGPSMSRLQSPRNLMFALKPA